MERVCWVLPFQVGLKGSEETSFFYSFVSLEGGLLIPGLGLPPGCLPAPGMVTVSPCCLPFWCMHPGAKFTKVGEHLSVGIWSSLLLQTKRPCI